MSEPKVARSLIQAIAALKEAEDSIENDSEYLREDIQELLSMTDSLFGKIWQEHFKEEAKGQLHDY